MEQRRPSQAKNRPSRPEHYPPRAGQQPQHAEHYPTHSEQCPARPAHYPSRTGQQPHRSGHYPPRPGQQSTRSGHYPRQSGNYPSQRRYNPARRRRRRRTNRLSSYLPLLVIGLAAFFLLFNRYHLEITLNGGKQITCEYGTVFQDPGTSLLLKGTMLYRGGRTPGDASITQEGTVDTSTLGTYEITYTAKYKKYDAKAVRKVVVQDTTAPIITLLGGDRFQAEPGSIYQEAGFQATDNYDGDLTDSVKRQDELGKIVYTVTDSSGNTATAERICPGYDPIPPEISLNGEAEMILELGTPYQEPGFTATDNADGDLSGSVTVEGAVNPQEPGYNTIIYTVSDRYGNTVTEKRTVIVKSSSGEIPAPKAVYLTFDDGPGPNTERLLDVLDKYGVKATFFVTNQNQDPEMMRQIVERGHSIGVHTASHVYSRIYASESAYFSDLNSMQDIIYQNTGIKTTLMRFPGGSSNMISAEYSPGIMSALTVAVEQAGFQYFDWNVDSNDAGGAETADEVFRNVVDGISSRQNSVVLQHDTYGFSVDAVEQIIQWGMQHSWQFLPLTQDSPSCHHGVNN